MLFLLPRLRTGLPASRRGDWLTLESPSCSRLQGASPETPSELRSPAVLCKTFLSGTKDGSAARICPGLVCCLGWPMVLQGDWSQTKDTASGSVRKKLHYLYNVEWKIELRFVELPPSTIVCNIASITTPREESRPYFLELYCVPLAHQPFSLTDPAPAKPYLGSAVPPSQLTALNCQPAMKASRHRQKQQEKQRAEHCCVSIISLRRRPWTRPGLIAVNWNISAHGWVSSDLTEWGCGGKGKKGKTHHV